jgi:uncharacterized protein (TIGR02246 family)
MADMAETESVLRGVLDRWQAAVDAHEPERVAAVFTQDAIFQGTHPYSVGPQGVAVYYASQPVGMKARHRVLEVRRPADDLVLGYLDVEFTFVDKQPLPVHLGVLLKRDAGTWHICHYQVSKGV